MPTMVLFYTPQILYYRQRHNTFPYHHLTFRNELILVLYNTL